MVARPLAASVAASVALHAAAAAWLAPSGNTGDRALPEGTAALSVTLKAEDHSRVPVASLQRLSSARRMTRGLPAGRYYTAAEVDIKATPIEMKTRPRTADNFPLGRISTAKLRLFINEEGGLDRYEVLAAERLPSREALRDFGEIRFRPAERGGRPVKSQKVVEISFIP